MVTSCQVLPLSSPVNVKSLPSSVAESAEVAKVTVGALSLSANVIDTCCAVLFSVAPPPLTLVTSIVAV